MPQQEGTVAGTKFYAWSYQDSGSYTVPQYNTGSYSGTTYGAYGSVNSYGTVGYTSYNTQIYDYSCVLRAFVDGRDRIINFDLNGDMGGCFPLVNRL